MQRFPKQHCLLGGSQAWPIILRIGVRLGYALSPTLFLSVLHNLMNKAVKSRKRGIQWGRMESWKDLDLADDNYEGWNFNFGNSAVTFDTAHLQSSYFHKPSMYSPKLCRTRSQRWGSHMMPLAAPVLLMVLTERSTAEGLNPPCNCPIR